MPLPTTKFEVINGLKKCTQCGEEKPPSEFHVRKGKHVKKTVLAAACKKCAHKCTLKSHKKNPDYQEIRYFWHIKKAYGLTQARYYSMLASQNGCCAICKCVPEISAKSTRLDFHVDHCHATGEIRGLLCANCNTTLGHSKDSIDRLIGCAIYLENFNNRKL